MKVRKKIVEYYEFYCEGCKHRHVYTVVDDNSQWQFNGNFESPTFIPSLLNTIPEKDEKGNWIEKYRCHLFVTDGRIVYCDDCTHELKGETIEMKQI